MIDILHSTACVIALYKIIEAALQIHYINFFLSTLGAVDPIRCNFFGAYCTQTNRLICPNILIYDKPMFLSEKNDFF